MQPLVTEFEDRLFRWRQVIREGEIAIFEQQHKMSGHCYSEVIKVRIQRAHTWPNGTTTPEHEAYPGATAWGRLGWTCTSLVQAQALLTTLAVSPSTEEPETEDDAPTLG